MDDYIFAERIKNLRLEAELSTEEVAQRLQAYGVKLNRSTLSRYETGACDATLKVAAALSEIYNVSLDYIVGLSDEKNGKFPPVLIEGNKPVRRQVQAQQKEQEKIG